MSATIIILPNIPAEHEGDEAWRQQAVRESRAFLAMMARHVPARAKPVLVVDNRPRARKG
jgi:hypothetical protein